MFLINLEWLPVFDGDTECLEWLDLHVHSMGAPRDHWEQRKPAPVFTI